MLRNLEMQAFAFLAFLPPASGAGLSCGGFETAAAAFVSRCAGYQVDFIAESGVYKGVQCLR